MVNIPEKRTFLLLIVLLISLFIFSCTHYVPEEKRRYVVVLSMDGFRHDYPEMYNTPNLDRIAEKGVRAEHILPVFPSFTFPNHYSMVTGLYPDNHGIVMNNFYCPRLDATFRIGDRDALTNPEFYEAEPLWVTAAYEGIITATYFWVGSEAPIGGIRPDFWKEYDPSVSYESRIDTVVAWLSLPPAERPQLVMFYFNEPDSEGHESGPDSPETATVVEYLDSLVGDLKTKIAALPHAYKIDVIITSDHGMGKVSHEKYVNLLDFIEWHWMEYRHGSNPVYIMRPREPFGDTLFSSLSSAENITVKWNNDLPARLNYGNHPRTLDMTVMADSGWSMGFGEPGSYHTGGAHGYDNSNRDMHTIFYAYGKSFKYGHINPPFEVIDLYPLIAYLLDITPLPSDACEERVKGMFRNRY